MLLIDCPWCGARHQSEFTYGGEAHITRPNDPDSVDDEEWAHYLFIRNNPKGAHQERWFHAFGCRRWFNAVRHTATDLIWATYLIGSPPPVPPDNWDGTVSKDEHDASIAAQRVSGETFLNEIERPTATTPTVESGTSDVTGDAKWPK